MKIYSEKIYSKKISLVKVEIITTRNKNKEKLKNEFPSNTVRITVYNNNIIIYSLE